jgi:hypothetical protein
MGRCSCGPPTCRFFGDNGDLFNAGSKAEQDPKPFRRDYITEIGVAIGCGRSLTPTDSFLRRHRLVLSVSAYTSPALSYAKLRADKDHVKRPDSSLRAESFRPVCRLFGGLHCA